MRDYFSDDGTTGEIMTVVGKGGPCSSCNTMIRNIPLTGRKESGDYIWYEVAPDQSCPTCNIMLNSYVVKKPLLIKLIEMIFR